MRLSISNLAWDVAEDDDVARSLRRYGIDAIDIAPGKYFPEPALASDRDVACVRGWWAEHGVEIVGMQALLFGTKGLNVFGTAEVRQAMLEHLAIVCRIGASLGATRLVFGSPRNRDRSGLTSHQAIDLALSFFRRLGALAESHGVVICLEPNPPCYGANFLTTGAETARFVEQVSHAAIRMQLDTGALTISGEDVALVLRGHGHLIGHVHASEPDLVPLGDGRTDHRKAHAALLKYLPEHMVTVEMLATKSERHVVAIERALRTAVESYRPEAGVHQ